MNYIAFPQFLFSAPFWDVRSDHGDFDRTMPKYFTDAFIITAIFNTPCSKCVSEAVEITVGNF